jgi:hypothetical protein
MPDEPVAAALAAGADDEDDDELAEPHAAAPAVRAEATISAVTGLRKDRRDIR